MPARSTLFVWLRQRPDFREKYKFAKRFQIQWLADEMVDIADDRANNWIERDGPNGKTVRVLNPENCRRQQLAALHGRMAGGPIQSPTELGISRPDPLLSDRSRE
jgi:hypothetical protein